MTKHFCDGCGRQVASVTVFWVKIESYTKEYDADGLNYVGTPLQAVITSELEVCEDCSRNMKRQFKADVLRSKLLSVSPTEQEVIS